MSDIASTHVEETGMAEAIEDTPITLAQFLETIPPSQTRTVQAKFVAQRVVRGDSHFVRVTVDWPDIQIHCTDQNCNGMRFYRPDDENFTTMVDQGWSEEFITYKCSNCRSQTRLFAVMGCVESRDPAGGQAICIKFLKLGEYPQFGPFTSPRLISLIGGDRDIFLQGRRCENQGLGIGAFAYYRRVVESQKSRILDNNIKAAEKTRATPEMIAALHKAKGETQFKRAVEDLKDAIPESLLVDGHNPLTLLHSALSDGLHARTDEECLDLAQTIRLVLGDLADRIAQALKDDRELNKAISKLMKKEVREGALVVEKDPE